jgi:tetratricopeptide (TPR) repeat protein
MKKIMLFLALVLLFSYQSVQAETPMKITSGQARLDEKKADADNEEEVGIAVVTGIKVVTGVNEIVETKEKIEEVKEAVGVTEATAVIESSEAAEIAGVEEVVDANGTDPVDYKALGVRSVELNSNDPDEVITLLEPHKNDRNNKSVLFYSSLGLAYKSKGRLGDAIAAYKRALELVPDVSAPAIQYNLGIAYYYNNELPESLNCFLNSSVYRSDHQGTKKWIKYVAGKLNVFKVPDTSKLKLVSNKKISVNRKKDDRESRFRMYLTQNGGRIQELSVKDRIYSYGIDSDTERPVDYIIIDSDGDGNFDNVINTKCKFGVPTWAYDPD